MLPYLILRLGQQHYALSIDEVVEVAAMVALTATPDQDEVLLGIANRHGAPLPILDLRAVFRQPVRPIDTATLFVVVQVAGQMAGLVVDDVLRIEYLDAPQPAPHRAQNQLIQAVIAHHDQIIQQLALPTLLARYLPQGVPAAIESTQVSE